MFTTSAGVHGPTLAEFAMFGVLAGAKDLPRLQAQQAQRQWTGRWAMRQVHEQTVLVAGLGGIGKQTARLAKAFGAYVIGTKRRPTPVENVDEVHPTGKLAELVGRADAIVFTLPGTIQHQRPVQRGTDSRDETRGGHRQRGSRVGDRRTALITGLKSGHLGSAFLDVFAVEPLPRASPLWGMPQVVIAPHTAALSPHEDRRIAELFAENLRRLINGEPLINVVDTTHFY